MGAPKAARLHGEQTQEWSDRELSSQKNTNCRNFIYLIESHSSSSLPDPTGRPWRMRRAIALAHHRAPHLHFHSANKYMPEFFWSSAVGSCLVLFRCLLIYRLTTEILRCQRPTRQNKYAAVASLNLKIGQGNSILLIKVSYSKGSIPFLFVNSSRACELESPNH